MSQSESVTTIQSQITAGDCSLCRQTEELKSLIVYEDEHWIARHSIETNILGYVLLQPRRHFLDLSHATECEADCYGPALRHIMQAIREVVDCPRIYTFSLGESTPHYHLHVIPRMDSMPRAYRARGVMQYPLEPVADRALVDEVCARLRRTLRYAPFK